MMQKSNISIFVRSLYVRMEALLVCLATFVTLLSCSHETLCEETTHPHRAFVNFTYDWSNVTGQGMIAPDTMFVLADRVVNQRFITLLYDTKKGIGSYLTGVPDSLRGRNKDIRNFAIPVGEYKFRTVNFSSDKCFNYQDITKKLRSGKATINLKDVDVEYITYTKASPLLQQPKEEWQDANQYIRPDGTPTGFVLTERAPLVIDSTSVSEWKLDDTKNVSFKPTTLSHNIDIFFDIKKDTRNVSFQIDSVFAIISGIPHRVNLGNGGLDISNTNKIIFKTKTVSPTAVPSINTREVKDSPSSTKVRCYKNVTVLGIVESDQENANQYAGLGVMQIIIYNKVYDTNQPGGFVTKKLVGMVNIHKSLKNAKLQTYDYEIGQYHKTREHSNLYISMDVTITKDLLMGTETGGIAKWNELPVPGEFVIY